MTPAESCFSMCVALIGSGHPGAVEIGQAEIRRMLLNIGDCVYTRARALENLAFDLAVAVEPNEVASALDREIADQLRSLGVVAI